MTQIRSKEIRMVPLSDIKPNPKNRNRHSKDQIARLTQIIEYQGFRQPLMVSNRSGLLVGGHGRLLAAKKLKLKEVPVCFQDFDSDEQEIAAGISDNSIASWAELDLEGINLDIPDLGPEFDIDLLGILNFKIDASDNEGLTDPDEVPETPKESPVCRGELFRLGSHRLLCGDSTSITDVERLMNGEKADMVFTDPPYGMSLNVNYDEMFGAKDSSHKDTGKRFKPVEGDDVEYDPNPIFAIPAKEYYIWGADYFYDKLPKGGSWIAWDKRDERLDLVPGNTTEFLWSKNPHRRVSLRIKWSGHHGMQREDTKSRIHPTQKPVQLIEKFFEDFGGKHVSIVDIYCGSGSTLIACEKTSRVCYGMEIDPHYCSVILDRWSAFTGKDPVRLNDDGTETPWAEIKATLKSSMLP
jgi:DNA modification methylase